MMQKILIANRGEIACRIIESCRRLNLHTVAVYSDVDVNARHVALADQSVAIGGAHARDSYLNSQTILEAARRVSATAIHPGYGFLSENAQFADAVSQAGMIWIGPSAETIINMGDKERARKIAFEAGVPILPGSERFVEQSGECLREAALQVGYPLLVKAAAGGGGIGMREVALPQDLLAIVETTQSMAGKAFGDRAIYLERFVPRARHIEVQIFGFGNGAAIHLHDRECSIQRRFQKIVEEAPAPNISTSVRHKLHGAAVALASAQNYSGAGTVEFIYDCDRDLVYFLEMNTRIQVEHPATEMVTGIDLVAWQITHALGTLGLISQESVSVTGHAIECRLYAERPEKNFLPSSGTINRLCWPRVDSTCRIDTGVREGDQISPYYDPMIAKIIALGGDRAGAIERMGRALDELTIDGLGTNAKFLADLVADGRFGAGDVTTGFVDHYFMKRETVSV
ncbi:MAG: acetyl-CoA carboxylase biotin carboxylase subunit [Advenella sp.]